MLEMLVPQKPPPILGRYEVVAKLGEGGMAETWLCRLNGHRGFSRKVVVKVLRTSFLDDPGYHTMFLDEARIGAILQHPHIPRVEEFNVLGNIPFMVQEYVEGPSLHQLFKRLRSRGPVEARVACRVVYDIAGALAYVHSAVDDSGRPLKLVHRDVSASNILVSTRGHAKLIDFGVARFEDREAQTEAGVLKGKLRYLAPEVILKGEIGPPGDIFSLGVVLYALVTGRFPWMRSASIPERLAGFPSPLEWMPNLDPDLADLILCTLDQDPTARPTAEALANGLQATLTKLGPVPDQELAELVDQVFPEGSLAWLNPPQTYHSSLTMAAAPLPKPWRGLRAPTVIGVALFLLLQGGIVAWVVGRTTETTDPPQEPQVVALLDEAESLLAQERYRTASELLDRAAVTNPGDSAIVIRMTRLASEAQRGTHLVAAERALETEDLDVARYHVYALLEEFPSDVRGLEILEQIRPEAPRSAPGQPAAKVGYLHVEGTEGGLLSVDGVPIGPTPLANLLLEPGAHHVTVRKEGYQPAQRDVVIPEGSTYVLDVILEPLSANADPDPSTPIGSAGEDPDTIVDPPDAGEAPIRTFSLNELEIRKRSTLRYPVQAKALGLGIQTCSARIFIDERGVPYQVDVESDCPAVFREVTEEGLLRWRWYPPRDQRGKVKAQTRVQLTYEP